MNRLTHFLLAGTIVPAMVLVPLVPVVAQNQDPRDRQHIQGQRPEGGDRVPHGGGGMQQGRPQQQGGNAGNFDRRQGGGVPRQDVRPRQDFGQGANQMPRVDRGPAHDMRRDGAGQDLRREARPAQGDAVRTGQPDQANRRVQEQRREDRKQNKMTGGDRDTQRLRRDPDEGPRGDAGRDKTLRHDESGVPRRLGDRDDRNILPPNTAPRDTIQRNDRRLGPAGAAIGIGVGAGVAAGLASGFLAPTNARRLDDVRRDRREVRDGDSTFIREPGRTIVEQDGRAFIVHDENDRFRALGLDVRRQRHGNTFVDTVNRAGGIEVVTYTDVTGRLLRRVRRTPDGREVVLIFNGNGGNLQRYEDDVIVLPPPPLRIPQNRYIVDYGDADEGLLYETFIAPPLAVPPHRYTLDQIRYSPDVRNYLRSVDIDTINFDTGSWDVPAAATGQLQALGQAIKRALARDPNAVFLVEGFTDATGNPDDNLSLSDRRAQSVAEILSKDFGVPPENLTTQGYGEQNPKEDTKGPSAANRRVVVQNITPLLAAGTQH